MHDYYYMIQYKITSNKFNICRTRTNLGNNTKAEQFGLDKL